MSIIQVAMIGIVGALFAIQFRQMKEEYSLYIIIGASLLLLFIILGRLRTIKDTMLRIQGYLGNYGSYVGIILKMLGITYVAEFAAAICKDAGYQTAASQIEVYAKLTILALSMPVLLALLETIQAFLS